MHVSTHPQLSLIMGGKMPPPNSSIARHISVKTMPPCILLMKKNGQKMPIGLLTIGVPQVE
jgi:hypothetical protein